MKDVINSKNEDLFETEAMREVHKEIAKVPFGRGVIISLVLVGLAIYVGATTILNPDPHTSSEYQGLIQQVETQTTNLQNAH